MNVMGCGRSISSIAPQQKCCFNMHLATDTNGYLRYFTEQSFLIPGTRAEDIWQGFETFLRGYEDFKSNFYGEQNYFA